MKYLGFLRFFVIVFCCLEVEVRPLGCGRNMVVFAGIKKPRWYSIICTRVRFRGKLLKNSDDLSLSWSVRPRKPVERVSD